MEFVSNTRSANSSFVEMLWHTHSDHADTFTSVAASNWEMVIATVNGETRITARGPETKASQADSPAASEFFGITFKLGTFMPHLPVKTLVDRQDMTLPEASSNSFWLYGSAWELPTFDNADVFIDRLIRQGILVRDPVVEATIQGHMPDLSIRSLQNHFLQATGLTYKTIQQIERAHTAVSLLEQGTPIFDTTFELGYFDQAHLTNSLKRFIGKTPAQIAQKSVVE
ncbi:helix-turn-helix domain-containing protein [Thermoleptolyngbya sp. C42_A2020_037]|uniref:helix-turn-helix domain-containing protein n=1 Tax=Thermoleptolyngbya sp. C42_A2020_037 TaxID=2747799 RepID=UPI0019E25C2F|nr:helix-turn-helix domain-containing protein [Thermoleptolyngbya sp. C42_A2020_037]MBF2085645.1 AraC family transcriptional regulator [Thermoleptolyngbya sp. C42_A2020_037]